MSEPETDERSSTASPGDAPGQDSTRRELRVLSGLHAGAAMPLVREEVHVGSDAECDVVLLDEGLPARTRIAVDESGAWRDGHGEEWPIGVPRSIGTTTLVICEPGQALEPLAQAPLPPEPKAADLSAAPGASGTDGSESEARETLSEADSRKHAWARRIAISGTVLALLGLAAVGVQAFLGRRPPTPRAAFASALPGPAPTQLRQLASDLLQTQGLDQTVHAIAAPGVLRLEGTADPGEVSKVRRVLAGLRTRLGSRIEVNDDVVAVPPDVLLQVRELVIGPVTHVTLMDGRTVVEGASIDGLRLTRIGDRQLAFVSDEASR